MDTVRLDKFLSRRGLSSRRGLKTFLKENEVLVNGRRVKAVGERIKPSDQVLVNGEKVDTEDLVYFALNKPVGIISTSSDELGRQNVVSLVKTDIRVYPVGRLDKDTSGLILLTNDGPLTHRLTHPKFHVPKKYILTVEGFVSEEQLKRFREGVILSDGITNPAGIERVGGKSLSVNPEKTIFKATLKEGRYRQIRRMCEALVINLLELERVEFGPVNLGKLKSGEYRSLTGKEISELKKATKLQS